MQEDAVSTTIGRHVPIRLNNMFPESWYRELFDGVYTCRFWGGGGGGLEILCPPLQDFGGRFLKTMNNFPIPELNSCQMAHSVESN